MMMMMLSSSSSLWLLSSLVVRIATHNGVSYDCDDFTKDVPTSVSKNHRM